MITLDTGALIAIERRRPRAKAILEVAWSARVPVTIPAPAWGEWHAGSPSHGLGRLAESVNVAPLTARLAELAGEALARLRLGSEHFVDAAVMATAASVGGVVYTSDLPDLTRLQQCFPSIRVLAV